MTTRFVKVTEGVCRFSCALAFFGLIGILMTLNSPFMGNFAAMMFVAGAGMMIVMGLSFAIFEACKGSSEDLDNLKA